MTSETGPFLINSNDAELSGKMYIRVLEKIIAVWAPVKLMQIETAFPTFQPKQDIQVPPVSPAAKREINA